MTTTNKTCVCWWFSNDDKTPSENPVIILALTHVVKTRSHQEKISSHGLTCDQTGQMCVCRWLNNIDQLLTQVKFVSADSLKCWPTTVPSQICGCRWLNNVDQLLSQVKFVSADGLTLLTNYCPKSNSCLQMPRQYWPTTDPSQIRVCWWLNNIDQLLPQVKFVSADGLTILINYYQQPQIWLGTVVGQYC